MHIGITIEHLIAIRDRYKDTMTSDERQALADACNILDKRFNRFDTPDILLNKYITSIHWQEADICSALKEKGYDISDENISKIFNYPGLEKYLQERGIEAGWEIIYNVISDLKDELSKTEE